MLARLIATFAYVSFAQSQQNIVSIGLQLPLSDPVACVSGASSDIALAFF